MFVHFVFKSDLIIGVYETFVSSSTTKQWGRLVSIGIQSANLATLFSQFPLSIAVSVIPIIIKDALADFGAAAAYKVKFWPKQKYGK